ncbi:MAG TPA: hypothetical protein VLD85_15590 [Anaeromyxobacteraceae bacterium]|nr:hypothetical protein [Anaeromyxobacteraceae bacterium]
MARLVSLVVAAVVLAGCGAGGKAGPPGTTGILEVLTSHTSFNPSTSATPFFCQTPTYTAGANQGAIIDVQVDCNSVPAGASHAIKPAYSDGVTDTELGWWVVNTNTGAVPVELGAWATAYTALTAGTTYAFEVELLNSSFNTTCYCDVTAQIIQQ